MKDRLGIDDQREYNQRCHLFLRNNCHNQFRRKTVKRLKSSRTSSNKNVNFLHVISHLLGENHGVRVQGNAWWYLSEQKIGYQLCIWRTTLTQVRISSLLDAFQILFCVLLFVVVIFCDWPIDNDHGWAEGQSNENENVCVRLALGNPHAPLS